MNELHFNISYFLKLYSILLCFSSLREIRYMAKIPKYTNGFVRFSVQSSVFSHIILFEGELPHKNSLQTPKAGL